jgi:general secretion pathway protein C
MKRLPILLSLLALIVLSASGAYWVLQLYQPAQRPLAAAPVASMPAPPLDAAASLFGGQASAAVASNYQLTGVVAAGPESVAIVVAEGSPPKAIKLGKEVVSGVTVQEVHPRYVMLSDGGVLKRIELAADAKSGGAVPASPLPGQPPVQPQQSPPPPQVQPAPTPTPLQAPSMQGQPAPVPAPPPPVQMPPPTRAINTNSGQAQLQ